MLTNANIRGLSDAGVCWGSGGRNSSRKLTLGAAQMLSNAIIKEDIVVPELLEKTCVVEALIDLELIIKTHVREAVAAVGKCGYSGSRRCYRPGGRRRAVFGQQKLTD